MLNLHLARHPHATSLPERFVERTAFEGVDTTTLLLLNFEMRGSRIDAARQRARDRHAARAARRGGIGGRGGGGGGRKRQQRRW